LSGAVQADEITRGLKKLEDHGIPVSGFRAPFLRFNEETAKAVVDSGLFWSSHSVMLFQNNPCCQKINECSNAKNLLEGFYTREPYEKQPSLPMWKNEVLEIPVSLPDDELMVDRLGMRRPDKITRVWLDMLSESNEQGELFNLIFHPERFDCVAKPLDALLEKAVSLGNVWIASLDEIGRWWRDRAACSFEITPNGPHGYQVTSRGNAGASIALQRPDGGAELIEVESNSTFNLEGRLRPTVGVSSGFCDKGAPCLLNEGFVVEAGRDHASCAVSLDGSCPNNRRRVLEILKTARSPLLRVTRWPHGYRSALAITLDLDAIILWDFVRRAWYFHKTARCRVEGSRH